ncbi:Smc4l1 protein [Salpingoeca rosetta]|uniref:Structural maintenance of chromosomes protein n=1 Tax=Salpingoeca rosetta (strain ATCC 50818 / BSB-021) TaxID=946362 RepID=F2U3W0_SALR5|nr:Smc4l1 protein [Salpingoeca rosetta]EGD82304.1 Smc4l1 protein [Salpingoeca rosetta]|eukprot:XP_004996487.1 Smc4l1 protein [Salpingoeca rosetta]
MSEGASGGSGADGRTPRLMITKMRLENFKSYYGVQEVGPFHKCFSAVVGPNGSGKSNVIDAMLFVFGFRAKKIRQAKLKDLIHNSEHHQNLPSCRVSVFMQEILDRDDGGFDIVPDSELVVAREATSSSQSFYYLNGKKRTFGEIADVLRSKGIDLDHNRFLILQGEVEQIAMMKPKAQNEHDVGLLEYLEDIIGSVRFKEDIAKHELMLEELNEKRNEKLSRVHVVEEEKNALEAGKKEAEAYLMQENELTMLRSKLFQCHLHQATENLEQLQEQADAKRRAVKDAKQEMKTVLHESKGIQKQYEKDKREYDSLKKAAEKAKADFIAYERKDIKHKEDMKHNKTKLKRIEKSMQKDEKALNEATSQVTAAQDDVSRLTDEIKGLEVSLSKEEKVLESLYNEFEDDRLAVQQRLHEKQEALVPLSSARDNAAAAYDIKKSERDLLTKGARDIEAQLQEATEGLAHARATLKERKGELVTLAARKKKLEAEVPAAEKQLRVLAKNQGPLDDEVSTRRMKLEERRSASQAQHTTNRVLEALKERARRGKITGFHGRLGSLGAIDDKYDCAVTTACGALNHLVVDTVEQGQQCVEFLRKHNVGRATFIILEKIQHLAAQADKPFNAPAPRLYDLIRVKDDKFKVAFYHALRDTLVAPSLDDATSIAYQGKRARYRVVTLKGQLIDTSGTMSGGGNKVQRGGMSSTLAEEVSPAELESLERELEQLVQRQRKAREQRSTWEEAVGAAKRELATVTANAQRCQQEIDSLTAKIDALTEKIATLEEQAKTVENNEAALAAVEKELAALGKKRDSAAAKAEKVEHEIAALEEELANVGGVRVKAQRAKVDGISDEISTLQGNITKANVTAKTAKRKKTQLEKKLEKAQAEKEETAAAIAKLKESFADIETKALEVMEEQKKATLLLEEREEAMQDIKEKYDQVEERLQALRSGLVDQEHELEEVDRELRDNQNKAKHWRRKLDALTLHKIDVDVDEEQEEEQEEAASADGTGGKSAMNTGDDDDEEEEEDKPSGDADNGDDENDEGGEEQPRRKKSKRTTQQQLPTLTAEDAAALNVDDLEYNITVLDEKLKGMKPNMSAISEYRKKESEYLARVDELDTVTGERNAVRAQYDSLRKQRLDMFMAGFKTISLKLKEMYQMITLGGDAELELVDYLNPFSEGIVFSVRPPKKSWKNISNLSGGEKTLSSLALVFALHHFKPTPLYVMDEIDAALDFKNVSIVANYIKERTKNAQFVIISLRNNMFELAVCFVGIYKPEMAPRASPSTRHKSQRKRGHTPPRP